MPEFILNAGVEIPLILILLALLGYLLVKWRMF